MEYILVTGDIASGKTTLLSKLSTHLKKGWRVDGVLSFSSKRKIKSREPSLCYNLHLIQKNKTLLWAHSPTMKDGIHRFEFNDDTLHQAEETLLKQSPEIMIIDNLGSLELSGKGFDSLLRQLLSRPINFLILSVKKNRLNDFISHYHLTNPHVIDLDEASPDDAFKKTLQLIQHSDSETIGLFATVAGLIEVSAGSMLHALNVPFSGHILTYTQNFLFILFGKKLNGRNLIWISLVTAGLKSFSPAGSKITPMIAIFVQGTLFALPAKLLRWNFLSAFIGSILMSWATIAVSLSSKYFMFGNSFIEAYVKGFDMLAHAVGMETLSFWNVLAFAVILKSVIASIVCSIAYPINFSSLMTKLESKIKKQRTLHSATPTLPHHTTKQSALGALRDLSKKRFLFPFLFVALLILFFTHLSKEQYALTLTRALLLAWLGFFIARKINFEVITRQLRKRNLGHIAHAMESALHTVISMQNAQKKEDPK